MRLFAIVVLLVAILVASCYPVERTEAQRYYDLGVSYIKSDLYEKGLETLNQVAFLYPDSDVADDALYQLALIREQVGDGEITIGEARSLRAMEAELSRLTGNTGRYGKLADILTTIRAHLKGEMELKVAAQQAIVQYLLALDYLNTVFQRHPDSDMMEESSAAFGRVTGKIDRLVKPKPPKSVTEEFLTLIGLSIAIVVLTGILMAARK